MTRSRLAGSIQGSVPTSKGGIVSPEATLEMLGAEGQRCTGEEGLRGRGAGCGARVTLSAPSPSPPPSPAP